MGKGTAPESALSITQHSFTTFEKELPTLITTQLSFSTFEIKLPTRLVGAENVDFDLGPRKRIANGAVGLTLLDTHYQAPELK